MKTYLKNCVNKKIACVSWCLADSRLNYGQILQAIAMMEILFKYNFEEVRYISYHPYNLKQLIRFSFERYRVKNGHLKAYIETKYMLYRFIKKRDIDFKQIRRRKKLFSSLKDFDILVCGSDAIWNPRNYQKEYFLDIDGINSKRIAYAPSLTKTHVENSYREIFKNITRHTKNFDFISTRELSSAKLLTQEAGMKVEHVIDPTLIVDKSLWMQFVLPYNVDGDYIFVYAPNEVDEGLGGIIDKISRNIGTEQIIFLITRGRNNTKYNSINYVNLGQFLFLIQNAKCIITTSYHATLFSIIFHKEFYCYSVMNSAQGEDNRLSDFISVVDLKSRQLFSPNEIDRGSIDYEDLDSRLQILRRKSIRYFDVAVEKCSE